MLLLPRFRNILDLLRCELEGRQVRQEHVQAVLVATRRDGHDALVQTPPQRNLSIADAVLFPQRLVDRVDGTTRGFSDGGQGSIRLDGDALALAKVDQASVLQVGMVLDLVHGRRYLGGLQDGLEVLLQVVGDADGLCASRGLDGFHIRPHPLQVLGRLGPERRVDEVQVDIGQLQLGEGAADGLLDAEAGLQLGLCGDE